jgi:hypothetical protein
MKTCKLMLMINLLKFLKRTDINFLLDQIFKLYDVFSFCRDEEDKS